MREGMSYESLRRLDATDRALLRWTVLCAILACVIMACAVIAVWIIMEPLRAVLR